MQKRIEAEDNMRKVQIEFQNYRDDPANQYRSPAVMMEMDQLRQTRDLNQREMEQLRDRISQLELENQNMRIRQESDQSQIQRDNSYL